ncbi:Protein CHLOROPLAST VESICULATION [Linum grandiflorum]
MASVACLVIGLETNWAIAGDVPMEKAITAAEKVSAPKWSDKRMCPAWELNSLETIVPEDLPRPSARRRWESVEFHGGRSTNDRSPAARGYQVVRGSIKGCFSM